MVFTRLEPGGNRDWSLLGAKLHEAGDRYTGTRAGLSWPTDQMACEIDSIAHQLLASDEEMGGINHLDGANLPSRGRVDRRSVAGAGLLFRDSSTEQP